MNKALIRFKINGVITMSAQHSKGWNASMSVAMNKNTVTTEKRDFVGDSCDLLLMLANRIELFAAKYFRAGDRVEVEGRFSPRQESVPTNGPHDRVELLFDQINVHHAKDGAKVDATEIFDEAWMMKYLKPRKATRQKTPVRDKKASPRKKLQAE